MLSSAEPTFHAAIHGDAVDDASESSIQVVPIHYPSALIFPFAWVVLRSSSARPGPARPSPSLVDPGELAKTQTGPTLNIRNHLSAHDSTPLQQGQAGLNRAIHPRLRMSGPGPPTDGYIPVAVGVHDENGTAGHLRADAQADPLVSSGRGNLEVEGACRGGRDGGASGHGHTVGWAGREGDLCCGKGC